MPLDSYDNLQTSVADWIARPGDPLLLDYAQLRHMYIQTSNGKRHFSFQTPVNMDTNFFYLDGYPVSYTIEGLNLRVVGNTGSTPDPITLDYFTGLTGLSEAVPTNWLLDQYPSAYLWGTLALAAPYIGDDPRIQLWMAAREESFEDIKQ